MNERLAAIDLGSNAFRLSTGRVVHDDTGIHLMVDAGMREITSLASGLGPEGAVADPTLDQAMQTLTRFADCLHDFAPTRVRAVATSAFRQASNAADMLQHACDTLGYPIEIISGEEEARLIYLGVQHYLEPSSQKRLVIDIGGGSTEFIIGRDRHIKLMESVEIGCTSLTKKFFADGRITEKRMSEAIESVRDQLHDLALLMRNTGWQHAYGSSGTAKGLLAVLLSNGLSREHITLGGLRLLAVELCRIGEVRLEDWVGLKAERVPVLAGGLAIMIAAFEELAIHSMSIGEGALRIGVLQDLCEHVSPCQSAACIADPAIQDPAE